MSHETDGTLLVQGACLKYLPTTIPHLLRVYSGKQLSTILTDLLVTLPTGRCHINLLLVHPTLPIHAGLGSIGAPYGQKLDLKQCTVRKSSISIKNGSGTSFGRNPLDKGLVGHH